MTDADAIRGRVLVEESRVLLASRRARQMVDGIREGELIPPDLLTGERGVSLGLEGEDVELAVRPRMLRVVARNLAENAISCEGAGATFTISIAREPAGRVLLTARDNTKAGGTVDARGG